MITPDLYQRYQQRLLAGDRRACGEIVQQLLDDGIGLEELYLDLFQTALYEVGSLWERNRISVAVEHTATAITEALMSLAYPRLFQVRRIGRTAVVTCATGELHQVGARMVADSLEMRGWDAHFLGSNTPLPDLLRYVDDTKPELLAISMSISSSLPRLQQSIPQIRSAQQDLTIAIGGQAFRLIGEDPFADQPKVHVLSAMSDLLTLVA
jgi:methanogenic corrinoid protein MtbC1